MDISSPTLAHYYAVQVSLLAYLRRSLPSEPTTAFLRDGDPEAYHSLLHSTLICSQSISSALDIGAALGDVEGTMRDVRALRLDAIFDKANLRLQTINRTIWSLFRSASNPKALNINQLTNGFVLNKVAHLCLHNADMT